MNSAEPKVVKLPITQQGRPTGHARSLTAQGAVNRFGEVFGKIVKRDTRAYWSDNGEIKPERITYGAFNQISYHAADGSVMHSCGASITQMRNERKFTRNAVEFRCDALGFAAYISGVTQINPDTKRSSSCVRIAAYQYESRTPEVFFAKDAEDLYSKLHLLLIRTYNKVGQEYNIAGLTVEDLTLISESPGLPNVAINAPL